ncbi:MAG TPA: AAA family ATPase [Acidimicrobiales bacterium]|nr:AAA family ATPase [Acidimicrobiales bacterium]
MSPVNAPAPTIYLLVGYPGTGKYTVAQELAKQLDAAGRTTRVVDNHYVNNPVFGLVQQDGVGNLPEGIWDRVGEVRGALLATIETLSPPGWSFVFTNWIGENESGAKDYLERLRAMAGARASEFVIVRLVCETAELTTRVATPQRRERMKWTDAAAVLRLTETHRLIDPGPPAITIDNTRLTPAECAAAILERAASR